MYTETAAECCPRFNPGPWNEQELQWEKKRFVKSRVTCFLHIPLNFGGVMKRSMAAIEAAGAKSDDMVTLSHDNSLWGSDLYIEVTKDVPGVEMAALSGTFLSKVFEGPYSNIRQWIGEMQAYVESKDKTFGQFYTMYTTCPKCSKKYGENYVGILAEV